MDYFDCIPVAMAKLRGEATEVRGRAILFACEDGVLVVVDVEKLPENDSGFFALHIHEGNSCEGMEFPSTKGHYNPNDQPHPKHAGDLPPLLSTGGRAYLAVKTDRFRAEDVIGKTVVIHSRADDFHTQPSGNAGEKIACGVIKRI